MAMIENKSKVTKSGKDRFCFFALALLISLQLVGCGVGFITFNTEDWDATQPAKHLAGIKFSYSEHKDQWEQRERHSLIGFSLERTLRGRFHVLDVERIPETDQNNDPERFIIRVHASDGELSLVEKIWLTVSVLSCAIIPVTASEEFSVDYTVFAPGGDEKIFRYRHAERSYSWLPFLFFGPGLFATFGATGSSDSYDEERMNVLDGIATRFLTEATPFILAHTVPSTQ